MSRGRGAPSVAALGLVLACQGDAEPAKARAGAGASAKAPAKIPEAQAPKTELCQLILDAEIPLIRAFISTSSEPLIGLEKLEKGSTGETLLEYLCPRERGQGTLIAMRPDKTVINAPIQIGTKADGFRLHPGDVREGLDQLSELQRTLLRNRWRDMVETPKDTASAGRRSHAPGPPAKPTPPPLEIPVTFKAHELDFVTLRVGDIQMELNPKSTRELAPGRYPLQVQFKNDPAWKPWGTLEIEAGKSRYELAFLVSDAKFRLSSE